MSRRMTIALGQFTAKETSEENLALVAGLIREASNRGAKLLVLPEGIIARKPGDNAWPRKHAEDLDGPFISGLKEATAGLDLAVVGTVHIRVPGSEKVHNDLVVVRNGQVELVYTKLHLYDAFKARESDNVVPGDTVPELVQVGPFSVGFMTCYDVRFPELARALVAKGANLLVVSAAWVRGDLKEMHWDLSVRSRALENTCYVAAVSSCGPVNIGESKIANPLGQVVAQCGYTDQLLFAEIDADEVECVRASLPVLANRRFADPELR